MSQYSDLGLPLINAGKVRELYQLPDPERMLMVATDNVSAFDYILDTKIPGKGKVLTQLSLWWFEQIPMANHLISTDVPELVEGRAMVVEKLQMIPVEAVVRGYLTGSGWVEYQASKTVCGIPLPDGLNDGSKLPAPIFTPAAKAEYGEHDENISYGQLVELVGEKTAAELRDASISIYKLAAAKCEEKGLILADTKFEFGRREDGTLVLADEVLTPDSSRYWDAEDYAAGKLKSFDKQYLRDWLSKDSGWDKNSTPPPLPEEIVTATINRYRDAYSRLTGRVL
ncbi:phosphoribosylaminoimidazolesuccinocarboxamide synthase [Propionimicrobium lymphophilum ACS-093-V-SCH5]|uniref:Phosphoribosylaminoimidazole-succinocarboxamide synthase n=1 Tax=Propionimicrobium lymphophilum ACS-093-V-SCH5 TaxID=883161 RepID=S2WX09_9ACTN|nr:phosphoribosylaminoimidazolesuccinocarboxamide synthase [Propionimicrobium lymphophilum ACS-093-V-SCH5]ETJ96793.1 phosphoribosylaminoimidazolesuccinocarboxamide synthase [Propionimicrobium sp. BV2F7]